VLLLPLGDCCNGARKFLNKLSVRVTTPADAFPNTMRLQELFLPEVRVSRLNEVAAKKSGMAWK